MTLPLSTRLALRQLAFLGPKLVGPLAGFGVAIVLVFTQIGFESALYSSATGLARSLVGDLVVASRKFDTMAFPQPWLDRSILYEAAAVRGVIAVAPLQLATLQAVTDDGRMASAWAVGVDPDAPALELPGVTAAADRLRKVGTAVIDSRSRNEYRGVVAAVAGGASREIILASPNRPLGARLDLIGLFTLGPTFFIDGTLVMSDFTLRQVFGTPATRISLGLVTVAPGHDVSVVAAALAQRLGEEALVYTKAEFVAHESDYYRTNTPIGIVFRIGVIVGLVIGAVFVSQTLATIVEASLSEYAVLKALGHDDALFRRTVAQVGLVIAAAVFPLAVAASLAIYALASDLTGLELAMEAETLLSVLALTLATMAVAVLATLGRLRRADPLDLFA
jgi:putative ABC transport system permease protein